jgi:tRNA pseudouridine55 synthase
MGASRRRQARDKDGPSGILIIDKPSGITSFGVVREARRTLGCFKAGHAGTLDPLATGVLTVCLGEATKIAGLLSNEDKAYRARILLGTATDSYDITGKIVFRGDFSSITRSRIEATLQGFVGEQAQVPPAFSAVRLDGVRAHTRARRGQEVQLAPRMITIFRLELLEWEPPELEVSLECSKGTFVRSLASDLGTRLGCGATILALRRWRSGSFILSQSVTLEELKKLAEGGDLPLISIDNALAHLEAVEVDADEARRLRLGQPIFKEGTSGTGLLRLRHGQILVALGEKREGHIWPKRVLRDSVDNPS